MSGFIGGLFNTADKIQMRSLNHRHVRGELLSANVANSETPGYRALGYSFEEQLAELAKLNQSTRMQVSHPRHLKHRLVRADGQIKPDVFVRPTESIGQDGNTVDIDDEMARLAKNQILYRTAVESINRKVGMLRYAINGGR